jgi:DNA-binding NarL/FixJ family response regulator
MKPAPRKKDRIPVWIVDDNKSFCIILRESLNDSKSVMCTGCFHSAQTTIDALATSDTPPSVILLDNMMQNLTGLDALGRLKQISPGTLIIMLTSYDTNENIRTALKRGAAGYLLKSSTPEQIIAAIQRALLGVKALDECILERMIHSYLGQIAENVFDLTEREKDVLKRISRGSTNQEVAKSLGISPYTINTHLKNIFHKLNVHSRHGMVAKAAKENLL